MTLNWKIRYEPSFVGFSFKKNKFKAIYNKKGKINDKMKQKLTKNMLKMSTYVKKEPVGKME